MSISTKLFLDSVRVESQEAIPCVPSVTSGRDDYGREPRLSETIRILDRGSDTRNLDPKTLKSLTQLTSATVDLGFINVVLKRSLSGTGDARYRCAIRFRPDQFSRP